VTLWKIYIVNFVLKYRTYLNENQYYLENMISVISFICSQIFRKQNGTVRKLCNIGPERLPEGMLFIFFKIQKIYVTPHSRSFVTCTFAMTPKICELGRRNGKVNTQCV